MSRCLKSKIRLIARLIHSDSRDVWLGVESGIALLVARVVIAISPVRWPFRLLEWSSGKEGRFSSYSKYGEPFAISLALMRCVNLLPGRYVCLHQALAASFMFWRRSLPLNVEVGVSKDENDEIRAHAWTEHCGVLVTGSDVDLGKFKTLITFEGSSKAKRPNGLLFSDSQV